MSTLSDTTENQNPAAGSKIPALVIFKFIAFMLLFLFLERKGHEEGVVMPAAEVPGAPVQEHKPVSPIVDLQASQDSAMKRPCFDTYFKLGYDYFVSKRYPETVEATLKALSYDPNSAAAWNNLCSAYNELHDWEKAIVAGKKAVQLKPDFELAKNNLAWAEKNKAAASK